MLWIKSFHIIFVASWFAGLFYLPRIFVNLAMVPPESVSEEQRLLLMARKLMRFTTLLMIPALVLGFVLWLVYGIGQGEGKRLDARQTRLGGVGDRLPPYVWRHVAQVRGACQPKKPCVVSLVQRVACGVADPHRDFGGGQAFLSPAPYATNLSLADVAYLSGAHRLRQSVSLCPMARPRHFYLGIFKCAMAKVLDGF